MTNQPGHAPKNGDDTTATETILASSTACEPAYGTLVEALRQAALEDPDRLYLRFEDAPAEEAGLTYRAAWHGAQGFAGRVAALGASPGDRVALVLPTGRAFVYAFFGAHLQRLTPVPYPTPFLSRGDDQDRYLALLRNIVADARARFLVVRPELAEYVTPLVATVPELEAIVVIDDAESAPPVDVALLEPEPQDVALIQYTSGPMTHPHGVVLSHAALLANVEGIGRALGMGRDDVGVSWLPLYQDMGLVGAVLTSLVWRYPSHFMLPEAFLLRPQRWLSLIAELRATISAAPSFAYHMCVRRLRPKHLEGLDLSAWRVALNGAEPIDPQAAEAFADAFASVGFRRAALVPAYGLAENGLAATIGPLDDPWRVEHVSPEALRPGGRATPDPGGVAAVSIGVPLAGQRVAIADSDGNLLPERHVGEILVDSPSVMRGYMGRTERTRRTLTAGWLHTGDLGYIAEGRLYITNRAKPLVIKRGRNYYPADIELAAAEILAQRPELAGSTGEDVARRLLAVAAASPKNGTEDLVLLVEADVPVDAHRDIAKQVDTHLLAGLGLRTDHCVFVKPGSLPRTASAAIDRDACLQRLAELVPALSEGKG